MRSAINRADASLARGEGRTVTRETMQAFADEIKQRGRARLAAD